MLVACGGDITTDSHGTIASPGSPGRYPPNRDCIWKLSAPPNKQIQLHFYTMQLESHETCQYDYLAVSSTNWMDSFSYKTWTSNYLEFNFPQIYNGLSTDGQLLDKFCNTSHPEPLSSSSNELTLHFHSDGDSNDMGFQIHYTVVDGIPGCGGTYTASSGNGILSVYFLPFCRSTALVRSIFWVQYNFEHSVFCRWNKFSKSRWVLYEKHWLQISHKNTKGFKDDHHIQLIQAWGWWRMSLWLYWSM